MKVADIISEVNDLDEEDRFKVVMMERLLRRAGYEGKVGRARFWDCPAVTFKINDVTFEISYDRTDVRLEWIVLRFLPGKAHRYRRHQFETTAEVLNAITDDALWERAL